MSSAICNVGELFRLMVEQNSAAITLTDRAGLIVYANPAQLASSGYRLDEVVGRSPHLFSAGETSDEVYEDMWSTILAGRVWTGELANRRKNGLMCWEFQRITPIRNETGEITHFLGIKEENPLGSLQSLLSGRVSAIDPVTGLPNRAMLVDRINRLLGASHDASAASQAVLMVAIDQFDVLHARIGQVAADELLMRIALRLRQYAGQAGLLGRVGCNDFALLVSAAEDDSALEELALRLLPAIAAPIFLNDRQIAVTASIGIARYPRDALGADQLLCCAGAALAATRSEGNDGFRIYAPPLAQAEKDWNDLRDALCGLADRDELVLEYQPKVDLLSGQIAGLEALLRWRHPEYGLLMPSRFLPIAEATGQVVELTKWVICRVLEQLSAWRRAGRPLLPVSVNLSLQHFCNRDLPDFIAAQLAASAVDPAFLEVEIAESTTVHDPGQSLILINRLKALGVQVALDGFGGRMSSLSYLARMNVDKLKIDHTFVRDIATNPVNSSIVEAVITMAHKLGRRVVATGVESVGQALQLRRHDCDEIQGFCFSPPSAVAEIESLISTGCRLDLESPPRKEGSLLLVDDEPSILSSLKRLLRREGYEILTAASGAEALDILATHPVDVIVSDHRMPGMSGVELLSAVRELYPDTRRIILSGYADTSTLADAINRGAVWKYICKPWDDAVLKAEINHAFEVVE